MHAGRGYGVLLTYYQPRSALEDGVCGAQELRPEVIPLRAQDRDTLFGFDCLIP